MMLFAMVLSLSVTAMAQRNSNHVAIGVGALYERGLDATISFEHETKYHNTWEFFANGYLKWDKDPKHDHVTPESFWKNYRTWSVGAAYKPCVVRGKNHFGNVRFGASGGSDTDRFVGIIHLGYEHNYALRKGWQVFWQIKTELAIKGEDLLRTGIVLGIKLPTN